MGINGYTLGKEMPLLSNFLDGTNRERLTNVSEFLQLVVIRKLLVTVNLYHPHGVMECWSTGVVGGKSGKELFF
jgi:hypothetical protein